MMRVDKIESLLSAKSEIGLVHEIGRAQCAPPRLALQTVHSQHVQSPVKGLEHVPLGWRVAALPLQNQPRNLTLQNHFRLEY